MSIKLKRTVLISMSALSLLSLAAMAPTTTATAKKRVKPGKVIRTMKYKTMKAKAKKGYIYKNTKLTKRGVHLTKYKNKVLSTNKAYLIKVPGKPAMWYDRVTSSNKKLNGYVFNNYLKVYKVKANTSKKIVKNQGVPKDPDANVPLNKLHSYGSDSSYLASLEPGTDTEPYYDLNRFDQFSPNLNTYKDELVHLINVERTNRGLSAMENTTVLDNIAAKRVHDCTASGTLEHRNSSGELIAALYAKKEGIQASKIAECLGGGFNAPAQMLARDNVRIYIYQDADSHWGHRDSLLDPNYSHIGVGVARLNTKMLYNAIVMY